VRRFLTACTSLLTPAAQEGLKTYYKAKIEEYEIAVRNKTQNLRRLEAQRNELNTKGARRQPLCARHAASVRAASHAASRRPARRAARRASLGTAPRWQPVSTGHRSFRRLTRARRASPLPRRSPRRAVRMLREELQLLQEPGSYVGEVVKVMSKTKVLVKARGPAPQLRGRDAHLGHVCHSGREPRALAPCGHVSGRARGVERRALAPRVALADARAPCAGAPGGQVRG
jgi:hypothetical protein